MSRIKSMLGIYAIASMAISGDFVGNNRDVGIETKETEEERKKRLAKAQIERYKANGLTEFFYGENSLWALNKKSADKKAKKRGLI